MSAVEMTQLGQGGVHAQAMLHPSSLDMAFDLAATGLPVFPCNAGKRPAIPKAKGGNGFRDASTDPDRIRELWDLAGDAAQLIGVPTGASSGFDVLDIDPRHGGDIWEVENSDRLGETRMHSTQSGGRHWLFAHVDGVRNGASKIAPGIDVRGQGGYVIIPPSPGYAVIHDVDIAPWPEWLLALILKVAEPSPRPDPGSYATPAKVTDNRLRGFIDREVRRVKDAAKGARHDVRLAAARSIGGVADQAGLSDPEIEEMLIAAQPPEVEEKKERRTIQDGIAHGRAAPIDLNKLPDSAQFRGYRPQPNGARNGTAPKADTLPSDAAIGLPDADLITEGAVADAFARQYRDQLRYDHHIGKWFCWDGARWKPEDTKRAYQWAHRKARELAVSSTKASVIIGASKAAFAAGVERLAQSDPAFAVTSEIWDADPWLLGTPGGTVDLCTGALRPASPHDYITKATAVRPGEPKDCSMWKAFIKQITGGDPAYARFLQQWCGYSLTGVTREHALLFIYGPGGNGKSVFLNTVAAVLGDYCRSAPMDTFTASTGDRHPTDLAMLRGARLVTATETEEGRAWAEARIKQMTGGDRIAARFMRRDFFEYTPQFKLTLIGNHKPVLRSVDDATRRRFNIGPILFVPETRDMQLEEKLRTERHGILAWMIDGGLDWQNNGLVRPQVVMEATADYFETQDLLGQWLAERCEEKATGTAPSSALYHDWATWAKARGEAPGTQKAFSEAMERRFRKQRTKTGVIFLGLRLLPSETGVYYG